MIFDCRTKTRCASGFGKLFKCRTKTPKCCFGNESRSKKVGEIQKYIPAISFFLASFLSIRCPCLRDKHQFQIFSHPILPALRFPFESLISSRSFCNREISSSIEIILKIWLIQTLWIEPILHFPALSQGSVLAIRAAFPYNFYRPSDPVVNSFKVFTLLRIPFPYDFYPLRDFILLQISFFYEFCSLGAFVSLQMSFP